MRPKNRPAISVLDQSDPNFEAKLRAAISAMPGEKITILTPQFERTKDMPPPTGVPSDWDALRLFSQADLKSMGCGVWNHPDERGLVLMLFPGEWYRAIPAGYEIVDINGHREPFEPGVTDDDIRFGCLAYGIEVPASD